MELSLFYKMLNNVWPMLVVFTLALCLIRFFYLRENREKFCFYKEIMYLVSIIYFWLLFEILTMTELNGAAGMNLVPFSEIGRYEIGTKLFTYNVLGNILIFVPFGALIGTYIKPKNIFPVLITALLTSVAVEFVQLNIGRSFDIDDIILNVLGGILGYFVYVSFSAIGKHLPKILKNDTFYNIVVLGIIVLLGIYFFGYWGVLFK